MAGRFEERVASLGDGIEKAVLAMPKDELDALVAQLAKERVELDGGTGELTGIKMIIDGILAVAG